MARTPTPPSDHRSEMIAIRVTAEMKHNIVDEAEKEGRTVSDWVYRLMVERLKCSEITIKRGLARIRKKAEADDSTN